MSFSVDIWTSWPLWDRPLHATLIDGGHIVDNNVNLQRDDDDGDNDDDGDDVDDDDGDDDDLQSDGW